MDERKCGVATHPANTWRSPAVRRGRVLALLICAVAITSSFLPMGSTARAADAIACLKPGSPEEEAAGLARVMALAAATPQAGNVGTRWSSTAIDGPTNQDGLPVMLTWGVVPDGTMIRGAAGIGDSDAVSSLRARLNVIYGNEATWMPLLQSAIESWGLDSGVVFVHELNDDGQQVDGTNAFQGQVGVRPDIRIGGHPIDGNGSIIGYTYEPQSGEMVLDSNDNFYNDTSGQSLSLRNAVSHELGHALGLSHVCPINETKLMEPFISDIFDGPQLDDLLGVTDMYGDAYEDNDTTGQSTDLGIAAGESTTLMDLSLDGAADLDWFQIPNESGLMVTATATPVGANYSVANASESTGCVGITPIVTNSTNYRDLQLEVLASDGTTSIAFADDNGFGSGESITTAVSGGGFVRVFGDFDSAPQLYDLAVTLVPEPGATLTHLVGLAVVTLLAKMKR